MSLGDPEDALLALQELADGDEDVALVLAASSLSSTAGRHLLEHVRRLHPHAGRALLVPTNFWQDLPATDAIRDSMALGRIDYYVPRPAGPLDEVFHEAISGFLLEWARDRRVVPQTVHIVGETLIVRGTSLGAGMSHYLVQAVEATPNVVVRTGTTVVGGGGDDRLQELVLRDSSGEEEIVAADALFVLIGAHPRIDWLPPGIARDAHGFLLTGADLDVREWPLERRPLLLETSMPRRARGGRRPPRVGQTGGLRGRRRRDRRAARPQPLRRRADALPRADREVGLSREPLSAFRGGRRIRLGARSM